MAEHVQLAPNLESSKKAEDYRNYVDSDRHLVVTNHYMNMRKFQTLEFVNRMLEKYSFKTGGRTRMSIKEAFRALENYVDSSDPDMSLPNFIHMIQTAEGIRAAGHPDWMQLVGLIHDMGKIMYLWGEEKDGQVGKAEGPQWALGGDTWVVGCRIPDCVVYPEFNSLSLDLSEPFSSSDLGVYSEGCGMHNLKFAFGHDEYLYQMMMANGSSLPAPALAMIRFHSLYPWHTGGAYRQFMKEGDEELLRWVLEFNKFDLYTKDNTTSSSPLTLEGCLSLFDSHYQPIIDKYFPQSQLMW